MQGDDLHARSLDSLIDECVANARRFTGRSDTPAVVVSPYRFNPLGAHIDHQGGAVLSRTLDQYTVLCFWADASGRTTLWSDVHGDHSGIAQQSQPAGSPQGTGGSRPESATGDNEVVAGRQQAASDQRWQRADFSLDELDDEHGWDAMPRAVVCAYDQSKGLSSGIVGVVSGTLVCGGLSSSASVILAYLSAYAQANNHSLSATDLVELCRQVENDYRGLKNGIQDQMSIAFGQPSSLSLLDVRSVTAETIADPPAIDQVEFLMCYSGVSRNLSGSSFNTRVGECRQAARLLCADAEDLGAVPVASRDQQTLATLPVVLRRRARHVFTEMQRVADGVQAWRQGDWKRFGDLMNASCRSSIEDYESGSEWLIALHEIANTISGVYGSRFSGGGYGGCLFMLIKASEANQIAEALREHYLTRYPEMSDRMRICLARSEGTVRVVTPAKTFPA